MDPPPPKKKKNLGGTKIVKVILELVACNISDFWVELVFRGTWLLTFISEKALVQKLCSLCVFIFFF